MRSWWLAAKIAAVFMLVMLTFVVGTLHLFSSLVLSTRHEGGGGVDEAHSHFVLLVLLFGLLAMLLMLGFSFYITAPLRRMSRSMDRIAAGDLEHRVRVKGRDEGAAMGRSFNAMAERVRSMIVGQKELMAGVSHELRSPLTRIKLSLELLREGKGDAGRISEMEADVDELNGMVEELLLASRIDLGASQLTLESQELAPLVDRAWARVSQTATEQKTTLVRDLGEGATSVHCNSALVVRALGNLFENAVRYGGSGEIALRSRRRGDRVELTVRDHGAGVAESDLERLFEPFFRADRSRSRKTGANGLGLMIVRRAVEAHGGEVRAELAEPRGLAVRFDLPATGSPPKL